MAPSKSPYFHIIMCTMKDCDYQRCACGIIYILQWFQEPEIIYQIDYTDISSRTKIYLRNHIHKSKQNMTLNAKEEANKHEK